MFNKWLTLLEANAHLKVVLTIKTYLQERPSTASNDEISLKYWPIPMCKQTKMFFKHFGVLSIDTKIGS